jgi:hypothetical protein
MLAAFWEAFLGPPVEMLLEHLHSRPKNAYQPWVGTDFRPGVKLVNHH